MPAGAVRGSLPSLRPHHSSEQHLPECRSPPVDSRPQGIESGQASLQEELGAAIGAEGSGSRARARKSAVSAEEAFTPLSLRVCICGSRWRAPMGAVGEREPAPAPGQPLALPHRPRTLRPRVAPINGDMEKPRAVQRRRPGPTQAKALLLQRE